MKLTLTIDINKLDKERINLRTYTNKAGEEVTVKEYKIDVVPLKETKLIKEGTSQKGDKWRLVESHFACDSQTKEEREQKKQTNFIGKAVQFEDVETDTVNEDDSISSSKAQDEVNEGDSSII